MELLLLLRVACDLYLAAELALLATGKNVDDVAWLARRQPSVPSCAP